MKKLFLIFLFWVTASSAFAKSYNLEITKQNIQIAGKKSEAIIVNGSLPAPTLYFEEGEEAIINVKNSMNEDTSIHWHGLLIDGAMDGVPGLNGFHGIKPNQTFTYKFKLRQSGTYWYHSHSNLQEQQGLYGAIVIKPKTDSLLVNSDVGSPYLLGLKREKNGEQPFLAERSLRQQTMGVHKVDKDYVIMLSDFSEENPRDIVNNLKMDSGYYNYHKRTIFTFFKDSKENGFFNTLGSYMDWGKMRMDPTDLSDVTHYHFLINGKTADKNLTEIFKAGEKVKLRFINAAAMTMFDVEIPGLKMKVVAADGQNIKPINVDEFRIGNAETYDVIVSPEHDKAYTIFSESLDRTGYAAATLAPKIGMKGVIPKMRPRAILTMADMAMNENMDHSMMDMNIKSGWENRGTPKGHRALEYSDLQSLYPQKDLRKPTREIEFRFGGAMNRYVWTINGEQFPKPFLIKYGERVRLKFVNETMMAHPIHLHGMFMQMENGQNIKWMPNKHTVIVPPAQTVSMLLTADEAGEWAFHCHLLYHMANGMMTSVTVKKD